MNDDPKAGELIGVFERWRQPEGCRCEARKVTFGRCEPWTFMVAVSVTPRGCPVHAQALYLDYLAQRFELSPFSVSWQDHATNPKLAWVEVDGKAALLARPDARTLYNAARAAMDQAQQAMLKRRL